MKRRGLVKALVAFALVLVVSPFAGSMAFADSANGQQDSGTTGTAVADPSTIWDWSEEHLLDYDTKNVGRIWTDKSVSTGEMTKDDITVEMKGENAKFLTALTALSSTSNLVSTASAPLDIVLVLDTSTSMNDPITGGTTKLAALKDAANDFVGKIAVQNEGISDAAKRHRVAVVSYNSSATTNVGMTACVGDDANKIKNEISSLTIGKSHGTRSDLGLGSAKTVLKEKRDGAKQVVVFFTDGTPTTSGSFMSTIASPAVGAAKDMKDDGATVYTIGVLDGADPSANPTATTTSDENKFLHAVSSNYPDATYEQSGYWSTYTWNFGDRAKDSKGNDTTFYKSANNADQLDNIFKEISGEITEGAGYPTDHTDGAADTSGYITFADQLGDYMQVTDLSTLVYNAKVYTCSSMTQEGNVDTYHFEGKVDAGIAEGNLSNIIITVTHSTEAAKGDVVQVQIPASLIPLRNFEVDLTDNKMGVSENTPVSVFYSSGLKSEAVDLLANPDDAMKEYIENNTGDDGKVNFYANKWNDNKRLGDVTAQFNPAKSNSYYYFTENTPIYTDADCTQRAKSIDKDESYYYKHTYYANEGGKPVLKTEELEFPGSAFIDAIVTESDGCYFKSGTARLNYINQLEKEKSKNVTGTARDVLNPKWNSEATTVTSYLGNNGKLSMEKPATLEVSKTVNAEGYSLDDYKNTDFTFNISVPNAAGKSFQAKVVDKDGNLVGKAFKLTFDEQGNATHTLKHGQTLKVFGFESGWEYAVSEGSLPAGFTQTEPVDAEGKAAAATGTFKAGETATAAFTNKYSATGTLEGATNLKVQKNLEGRDWTDKDSFTFELEAVTEGAPMPESGTVTVTSSDASSFGDIAYTKPGTYEYKVTEVVPTERLGGVTYSKAEYQVVVTVTDNHDGTLKVESATTKANDDSGDKATGKLVPGEPMAFTNSYTATYDYGANGGLQVSKTLTGRDMAADEFGFTITGKDDASAALLSDVDRSFSNGAADAGVANEMKKLASVKFTQADAGKTFAFTVAESVPVDAQKLPGVTYDAASHEVKITVADNHDGTLKVVTTVDGAEGNTVAFKNAYAAEQVSYDATAALSMSKALTGRDWTDNDSFTFELKAETANAPMPQTTSVTVTKADLADGKAAIAFGEATYIEPGTYKYQVAEVNGGKTIDGVTYDSNIAKFTVTVTDLDDQGAHTGELAAQVTLDSGSKAFTNTYKASSASYDTAAAGLLKVIDGRDWTGNDSFTFAITAQDGAPMPKDASGADVSTVEVTKANAQNFSFGTITYTPEMLDGATSKVFTYTVVEQEQSGSGITPDSHTATIKVTVTDNGAGQLTATASVEGEKEFTNTYEAETKDPVSIAANKELTGRDLVDGEFSFGVKYAKDYAAKTGEELLKATNDAKGNISFGKFEYSTDTLAQLVNDGYATKSGNKWTVNYMAYENTDGLSDKGITPTTSSVAFTVEVTDNLDGTLSAKVNPEKIKFENQYKAESTSVSLTGLKVLDRAEGLTPGDITGKFTFTISSDDPNAPLPKTGKVTATNDANDNIAFDEIVFTAEDLNKALNKTEEVNLASEATVQNEQSGNEAAQSGAAGTKAATSQSKAAGAENGSAANTESTQKEATNNTNEQLSNEASGQSVDGTEANSDGTDTAKAVDDAESQGLMAKLGATPAYADEAPAQTRSYAFEYKVTESGSVAGVTNDTSVKTIKITVTDDGQGKLTAEVEGAPFTFTNKYSVQPVTMSITDQVAVNKKLVGRDLTEGEFNFELLDANNEVVAKGTNNASGAVMLSSLTYTEPGEHLYTLREVNGGKTVDSVVNDSATYSVLVKVTDNGDGTLKAESQIGESLDGLTFTNTYIEPEPEPTPAVTPSEPTGGEKVVTATTTTTTVKSAKTGDNTAGIAVVAVIVAAAAGAFALLARRRNQ